MRAKRIGRATAWVALVVTATAIGSALLSRSPEPRGTAVGYVSLPTATPVPRYPREFSLPGGVTDKSALVMIQGGVARRLTVWPLNGSGPPVEVDRGVELFPLLPNPAGTRVLYGVGRAVMVLDVPERRAQIVGEVPEGGALLSAQWSPNGQMIAYVLQLADKRVSYVAWQNGSRPAREMLRTPRGMPIDVAWLADGRPVTLYLGVGPVGGLVARMVVYDWQAGELQPLWSDARLLQPYAPWRSPDGHRQLFPLYDVSDRRIGGGCPTGAVGLASAAWLPLAEAGSGAPHEIAFEEKRILLDHPTWLQDGRVLVRGMASAACAKRGSGLYIGVPGEPLTRLHSVQSALDTYDLGGALDGFDYAVSRDEQYVMWADADLAAARSTVYRACLDGGATETLYQTPDRYADATMLFKDREMIVALVWLP